MNYTPQVGDRVADLNLEDEGTVLFVHAGQSVVVIDGDLAVYWADELVKVEPRPKVREQKLWLTGSGGISYLSTSPNARIVAKTYRDALIFEGTVTVAVVCDLDGRPLEVQT